MTLRRPVSATVLLAVDEATRSLTVDDRLLRDALERRGAATDAIVWGDEPPPDTIVVMRSTWDYVERPAEFLGWLDRLDAAGVAVHNPVQLVRWNADKRYLLDLLDAGHPVVPTRLLRQGSSTTLDALRSSLGAERIVAKPAIGASGRGAIESAVAGDAAFAHHLATWLAAEDMIVQPFVESVPSDGERSVVVFDGVISHAVRKAPRAGDWRVQTEFGGSTESCDVDPTTGDCCRRLLAALDPRPTFARIDLVELDGRPHVMELELIEPDLFFGHAVGSADRLADAVLRVGPTHSGPSTTG